MRAYSSLYEEPTFEDPTAKEHSVVYAALGAAAVAVASTVAAIQMSGPPTWLSAAYVRTLPYFVCRAACLTSPCPLPSTPIPFTRLHVPAVQACKQPLVGAICRALGVPAD